MTHTIKKILGIFVLLAIVTPFHFAHAGSCDVINSQDSYDTCCTGSNPQGDSGQCTIFKVGQAAATTTQCSNITTDDQYNKCCKADPNTAACMTYFASSVQAGQINGGTPATSALNTDPYAGSVVSNTATTFSGLGSCTAIKFKSLLDILIWVKCIITIVLIPLIFTLSFLFFLWGILQFMMASTQAEREAGKQRMLWGIIALFVMLSVWGIIKIISNTLGIDPSVPLLQTEYLDVKKANTK